MYPGKRKNNDGMEDMKGVFEINAEKGIADKSKRNSLLELK